MTVDNGENLRTSTHLRVIARQSDYAVYHEVYGGLCLVSRETIDLLRYFETPKSRLQAIHDGRLTAQQAESFLTFFESRRLLVSADTDEKRIMVERRRQREQDLAVGRQVRAVQLVLTNRCNLRCEYCFEALGGTPLSRTVYAHASPERLEAQSSPANAMMSPARATAYLNAAIEMARRAGNNALAVQFFGGEPLVNWKTVQHILRHFGREHDGMRFSYSVVTNGSIMTPEMAHTLKQFEVPVIVSFDGPDERSRPMAGGKDSAYAVRRGINLLQEYGNRVALNAALTNATFDFLDCGLIDFALARGIDEIGVVLDLDPSFYEQHGNGVIADKLWDLREYGRLKGVVLTGYWHQIFQGIAANDRYGEIGYQNCSAMGAQFSIEPSGAVFACKASGGYFGNVLQIEDLLHSATYRKYALRASVLPEHCYNCEIRFFCAGLCLGSLENKYDGDIWSVEENSCNVYRRVTRHFINDATDRQIPTFHLQQPVSSAGQEQSG